MFISLKSNMDRFIGNYKYIPNIPKYSLKSNMDRFIGRFNVFPASDHRRLKSNMDRFIVVSCVAGNC